MSFMCNFLGDLSVFQKCLNGVSMLLLKVFKGSLALPVYCCMAVIVAKNYVIFQDVDCVFLSHPNHLRNVTSDLFTNLIWS